MAAPTCTFDEHSLRSIAKRLSDPYDGCPDRCVSAGADTIAWIALQLMGFLLLVAVEVFIIWQANVENKSKVFEHELIDLHATPARDEWPTDTPGTDEYLETGSVDSTSSDLKDSTQARKYARVPWFWLPVAGQLYLTYLITTSCFGTLDIEMTNGLLAFSIATILSTWILAVVGLAGAINENAAGNW